MPLSLYNNLLFDHIDEFEFFRFKGPWHSAVVIITPDLHVLKRNCPSSLCVSAQQRSFNFNKKKNLATKDFHLLNLSKKAKSNLIEFH